MPDPEQLYAVRATAPIALVNRFSGPMFERLRTGAPEGTGLAAMSRVARVYARTEQEREIAPAALQLVSPDYFRVLAVAPVIGGLPHAEGAGAVAPAALVSYGFWQRRLGGAADVLGRTLAINGFAFTIAGVGPRGFTGVWLESPVDIGCRWRCSRGQSTTELQHGWRRRQPSVDRSRARGGWTSSFNAAQAAATLAGTSTASCRRSRKEGAYTWTVRPRFEPTAVLDAADRPHRHGGARDADCLCERRELPLAGPRAPAGDGAADVPRAGRTGCFTSC